MRVVLFVVLVFTTANLMGDEREDALKAAAGQAEALKKVMAKFDLDGNGAVEDAEKAKVLEKLKAEFANGKIPPEFQDLLDRNGNKKLDAEEAAAFRDLVARLQAGGGGPGGARGGFGAPGFGAPGFGDGSGGFGNQVPPDVLKKFDKNKNGTLDEDEMKAAKSALGPKKSRKEQLLEKLDLNGDGKITADEREQVAAQRKAEQEEKKEEKKSKSKKKDDDK